MPTIAAGASSTISLPAGRTFSYTGAGSSGSVLVFGPGPAAGQPYALMSSGVLGPFGEDRTLYVTAARAITYSTDGPVGEDGLTAAQQAAGATGVAGVTADGSLVLPDSTRLPSTRSFLGCRNITGTGQSGFSTSGSNYTWHLCIALPVGFHAVRPVFGNTLAAALTGVSCAASVGGNGSDLLNNAGAWTVGTWGGAASGTVPGGGTVAAPVFSTPTDWIATEDTPRTDAGTLPLVYIRVMTPLANATIPLIGPGASFNWDAPADGYIFSHRFQAGDFVGTPSGMTGSTNPFGAPICGVQFLAKKEITTVLFIGDSITHGFAASPLMNSFAHQAAVSVSTADAPVVCANFGANSRNSTEFAARAESLIPLIQPAVVVMPAGSPNDGTPTAAIINAKRAYQRRALMAASSGRVKKLVVWGELPKTTDATNATASYNVAQDLLRKTNNRDTSLGVTVVSMASMQDTDSDAAASKWASTSITSDGTHPNAAGYAIMTPLIAEAIR